MSTTISPDVDVESWFRNYAGRLHFVARKILGNAQDAEDATQDAFLAVFRARGRYDGSDPYPWLYRIATRKALNIAAARSSRRALPVAPVAVAPSAEEEALLHLRTDSLTRLVSEDPALALHLIGDLPFREIGVRLGTPLATAATRVRRGKRRLRSVLEATLTELPRSKPA